MLTIILSILLSIALVLCAFVVCYIRKLIIQNRRLIKENSKLRNEIKLFSGVVIQQLDHYLEHPQCEKCEYEEEYYGHKCKNCGIFYAHGNAPWDDLYPY